MPLPHVLNLADSLTSFSDSYLSGLSLILISGVGVFCLAYLNYVLGCIRASRTIHNRLLDAITGTTLR